MVFSSENASTSPMQKLAEIMRFLRRHEDGCAWTKAQTHQTLAPYLIEETYETVEVIDQGKTDDLLRDELGDLLLQIAFHAEIASERGAFTLDDVAQAIVDKLERRYPTILGNEPNTLKTPEEIDSRWEEVKAEERRKKGISPDTASILDEISTALPALVRANKLKTRAAKAGWDWPSLDMLFEKIIEEVNELKAEIMAEKPVQERIAAEFGDVVFMLVDLTRWFGVDAEDALRTTNNRFETRFRYMESALRKNGLSFQNSTPKEWLKFWNEAKEEEKKLNVAF